MIPILLSILAAVGMFFILLDALRVPYLKTSKAVEHLSKNQSGKVSAFEMRLHSLARLFSRMIRMSRFKRIKLEADLRAAGMNKTPEEYVAFAIVKALLIGILAIPALWIAPLISVLIVFAAFLIYRQSMNTIQVALRKKRDQIEYELPRMVAYIDRTVAHNRDVLSMLEHYRDSAGEDLKRELTITTADMHSGNGEAALTRLESRVGSAMVSDVCRGLIGVLRGDDMGMYWTALSLKFNDYHRQRLRLEAQKAPRRVKYLSMALLFCFMLVYLVVILMQIITSLSTLFG